MSPTLDPRHFITISLRPSEIGARTLEQLGELIHEELGERDDAASAAVRLLLEPLALARFEAQHWDRAPAHIERDEPERFCSLMTLPELDALLTHHPLGPRQLELASAGRLPAAEFMRPDHGYRRAQLDGALGANAPLRAAPRSIDPAAALDAYGSGATLVFNDAHDWSAALGRFAAALGRALSRPLHVSLYLTPPRAQGFSRHYDAHDVFILQLEGCKRWRIFEPSFARPLDIDAQQFEGEAPRTKLVNELDLRPGDTLYIPRGYYHEAETDAQHSAHLTVGIAAYTYFDALQEAWLSVLAEARLDPSLRRSLPLAFHAARAREAVTRTLDGLNARLTASLAPGSGLEQLTRRFVLTAPGEHAGRFADLHAVETLELGTALRRRAAMFRLFVIEDTDALRAIGAPESFAPGAVGLEFEGRQVLVPALARAAMEHIAHHRELRAGALPGLEPASALELVRHLLREGFLSLA